MKKGWRRVILISVLVFVWFCVLGFLGMARNSLYGEYSMSGQPTIALIMLFALAGGIVAILRWTKDK